MKCGMILLIHSRTSAVKGQKCALLIWFQQGILNTYVIMRPRLLKLNYDVRKLRKAALKVSSK